MSAQTSPRWIDRPLLGFDTETTGTSVRDDRIVTVALVHSVGQGRENETVATWLIDPGMPIPEQASAIHGISTEHAAAHGMAPAAALEEVAAMIAEALGADVPLVAFNGAFDVQIIENELRRHELPTIADRLGHDVAPLVDPLVIDRGVQQDGRLHTADVDVSSTLDVLRAMVAKHPALAETSLEELFRQEMQWHREWAENFIGYMKKQGKDVDVSTTWPL